MTKQFLLAAAMLVGFTASAQAQAQRSGFPHRRHESLFVTCSGCHAGIKTGDASKAFPAPAACAACHDGKELQAVRWAAPSRKPTNLAFSHAEHLAQSTEAGTPADCVSCHATPTDTAWMHVRGASAGGCVTCHTNATSEHLAETANCRTCHRTLADSKELTPEMIAAFPKPRSHGNADFASNHAPKSNASIAQCATCHARESCARCHPNASRVPAIAQLASDPRVAELMRGRTGLYPIPDSHHDAKWTVTHGKQANGAIATCANCHTQTSCARCHANASRVRVIAQLPADTAVGALMRGRPAVYPTPASHRDSRWTVSHGTAAARSIANCANCHTQPACKTCHVGDRAPRVIAELPVPVPGGAPGVALTRVSMHEANYLDHHKAGAASGRLDCTSCHQQRECSSCHEGASSRRYHATDFMSRHPSEAFSQEQTCATCHRTETFCRNCHMQNGIATTGAKTGAAHTAQPLWLLQHGEAARRGLTGCTTCHQQRDCLRCHSSQGLKVNPHGPDFDASRVSARAKQMCATCHVTDPLKP